MIYTTIVIQSTDHDAKISDSKYFTTSDYYKNTDDILNAKKKKKLFNKSDTSGFTDKKIEVLATKAELKAEQDKKKETENV